jgi:hypothetical protein
MNHHPISRLPLALVLLAGVTLASGCNKGSATHSSTTSSADSGKGQTPTNVDFTLTSEQLAREFDSDKVDAEKKYKDKWIEVEGPMENVTVLPSGDVNIRLTGFRLDPKKLMGHSIRGAPPAAETEKLKGLTRGQKVKLKGKFDSEALGMFVDLVPCEVVSIGPDPALPVTVDQLIQDYARDVKAADARYKDKWLLVEAVVFELKGTKSGADSVVLEGAGEKDGNLLRISAAYPADRKNDFAALKKGDKVKIKGECGGQVRGVITLSYAVLVK